MKTVLQRAASLRLRIPLSSVTEKLFHDRVHLGTACLGLIQFRLSFITGDFKAREYLSWCLCLGLIQFRLSFITGDFKAREYLSWCLCHHQSPLLVCEVFAYS